MTATITAQILFQLNFEPSCQQCRKKYPHALTNQRDSHGGDSLSLIRAVEHQHLCKDINYSSCTVGATNL